MKKLSLISIAVLSSLSFHSFAKDCDPSLLPSWKDVESKQALVKFVDRSTNKASSGFIEVKDRIAVFDNDGTLWSEKPFYFQLAFAMDQVKKMAPEHPEWRTEQPFKAVLAGDNEAVLASGNEGLLKLVMATHSGMTVEQYQETVKQWLSVARDPRFNKEYTALTYKPMKEMLLYLQENDFKTYIVSGGGVDFMRAWAPEVYNVPSEQIIGSALRYEYQYNEGNPAVIKKDAVLTIDDKEGKVTNIQHIIGKKPVLAVGNSDGDQA
ncbi:nonspecific acid phosphatase precursor [Vibrio ishigakensis]|uniref:Nonspecific acid phosphatase n=1 Tax=Vibrio ishigakensis TaxID=1481914 RepID=A0A0B8PBE1_9VIBR|nr:nonspecific acid phosphatase precursor [Vibrio ishigakensis]